LHVDDDQGRAVEIDRDRTGLRVDECFRHVTPLVIEVTQAACHLEEGVTPSPNASPAKMISLPNQMVGKGGQG
jgi:hypothetical protein